MEYQFESCTFFRGTSFSFLSFFLLYYKDFSFLSFLFSMSKLNYYKYLKSDNFIPNYKETIINKWYIRYMKYKYIAKVKPEYSFDVTDWNDENEPKSKMVKRIKEELSDISVFSIHCDYESLQNVSIEIEKVPIEELSN